MIIDQSQAHCYVYTGREGALSVVGHDLKIEVTKFTLEFKDGRVTGNFDTESLRVLGAVEDGIVDKDELKGSDVSKIEKSIKKEVLQTKKYPKIWFEGDFEADGDDLVADGELTLNGQTKPLKVRATKGEDGWWQSRTTIDQTKWGMKPFKALLGQLRLAKDLDIELQMPPEIL